MSVYSQTVSHPTDLRNLDDSHLLQEMVGSKRSLETHFGHAVSFLAYPNGKFDARVARAAQSAGYIMAFTEHLDPCEKSPNLFMVSRYNHTKYRQAWSDAGRP